jgi:hypothetical protein
MATQTVSAIAGIHVVTTVYDTGLTEMRFYGDDRTRTLYIVDRQVGFAWHSHAMDPPRDSADLALREGPDGLRHHTRTEAVQHAVRACHMTQKGTLP